MTESSKYIEALSAPDPSIRLRAALHAGTRPEAAAVAPLMERCGVEPDFFVRDMLTWALTRHDRSAVVPRLTAVLDDPDQPEQAHAQALHTVSKIGAPEVWPSITRDMLTSENDDVATAAWRAAVEVVPETERHELAEVLAGQFGRGGRERRRSLSRVLVALGSAGVDAAEKAATVDDQHVVAHARATLRLANDPDAAFDDDVSTALRVLAPGASMEVEEARSEDR